MKQNSQAGVTLIEILIAVSLLSLLSVGMLVAMRLGFNTMDKTDAKLVRNRRVANSRQVIESEIKGFTASTAYYHPAPLATNRILFLQAEEKTMRFLTSYSIDEGWRGRPQIAVMQVIPGENNEGVRLIVNETPYTGPEQAGLQVVGIEENPAGAIPHFAAVEAGSQSFVLADRLAYCRFSYLGKRPPAVLPSWSAIWISPQTLPMAVRIEMAPLEPRATDLQVGTITVPFSVNLVPGLNYADFTPPRP